MRLMVDYRFLGNIEKIKIVDLAECRKYVSECESWCRTGIMGMLKITYECLNQ